MYHKFIKKIHEELEVNMGETPSLIPIKKTIQELKEKQKLPREIEDPYDEEFEIQEFLKKAQDFDFQTCMEFLAKLRLNLETTIGLPLTKTYMKKTGIRTGKEKAQDVDISEIKEQIQETFQTKVELSHENDKYYFTIEHGSPLAKTYGQADQTVCELIAGYIEGFLDKKDNYASKEINCRSLGEESCVFKVFKPESSAQLLKEYL